MINYMTEHGYLESAQRLQMESGITLAKFAIADNIDLVSIVQVWMGQTLF